MLSVCFAGCCLTGHRLHGYRFSVLSNKMLKLEEASWLAALSESCMRQVPAGVCVHSKAEAVGCQNTPHLIGAFNHVQPERRADLEETSGMRLISSHVRAAKPNVQLMRSLLLLDTGISTLILYMHVYVYIYIYVYVYVYVCVCLFFVG